MCFIESGLQMMNAAYSSEARSNQAELAKQNARLQRYQIAEQVGQESELSAQKAYELSRAALVARGSANAQNLGDRSVRALGRAIGFELGQDKSILARNIEIINAQAAARLQGVDISLASAKVQIGSSSNTSLGLEIFGTIVETGRLGNILGSQNMNGMFGSGGGMTVGNAAAIDAASAGGAAATGGGVGGTGALGGSASALVLA